MAHDPFESRVSSLESRVPIPTPFCMKRTQRNLFIIMAAMVAFYSIVTRLPWQAALAVAGAALIGFIALAVWGRDYFAARRHARKRQWPLAIERYQRFEQKALKAAWRRFAVVLALSV